MGSYAHNSYSQNSYSQNTTPILDLDTIDYGNNHNQGNFDINLSNHSGHNSNRNQKQAMYKSMDILTPEYTDKLDRHIRTNFTPPHESGMVSISTTPIDDILNPKEPVSEKEIIKFTQFDGLNCIEIANHVANCPICSRFYNTDKTAYIIAIIILALICLVLLKKVLES